MGLKLRIRPQFPALVEVTSPITLTKNGSTYTFGFNMDQAPTGPQGPQGPSGSSGASYGGTSSTSLAIANLVTKTFTTQAGLAYQAGDYVRAHSVSAPSNYMEGNISGYSGTTLSINVTAIGGSGTFTDWAFQPSGSPGSVGVSTLNGQLGALTLQIQPQGRITLTSGVAVMATTVAGATTVFYTLANGNQVPIYDGTYFIPTTFTELSQATTDATKSPAAVANNSNYDLFIWSDGGAIRCTRGPAWSSSTSRGTGVGTTELQAVGGVYLNKNAITNGPAANRGTYVGTIRSNGTATIDWILGASGTAGVLGVWNNYNRVQVTTTAYESTATWTYSSTTIRQVRASATNQISVVCGLPEEAIDVSVFVSFNLASVVGANCRTGYAMDSTTSFDKQGVTTNSAAATLGDCICIRSGYAPQTGYHTFYALEGGDGANSTTFVGGDRHGLTVSTFM